MHLFQKIAQNDRRIFILLCATVIVATFALRSYLYINTDVAFLVWSTDQLLGPPVLGVDILEINPPLCLFIYLPAVLISKLIGYEWGIRVWMLILSLLCIFVFWKVADKKSRAMVATAIVLFILLVYPMHYGQREQIVFLLCAPYVAGSSSHRFWALASGVLAGLGFLTKPYFLIPLVLVIALRRRLGIEELVVAAMGIAYALVLIVFFQPYLFEMVPVVRATYWAMTLSWWYTTQDVAMILLASVPLVIAGAIPIAGRSYFVAMLGFTVAAVLQGKGFAYHFIPAFGFLGICLTFGIASSRRFYSTISAMFLLMYLVWFGTISYLFSTKTGLAEKIREEIDRSESYISLHPNPSPAFSAAIYSTSKFKGIAGCQLFLPAVNKHLRHQGRGDPEVAYRLARDQAKRELRNKPDIVLTTRTDFDGEPFDYLSWLQQDPEFQELWKHYHAYRTIGPVTFYRRDTLEPKAHR